MKRIIFGILAAAALCCVVFTAVLPAEAMDTDGTSVLFVNVGKADAAILFLGERCYLIDTGSSDSYELLARALETCDVKKLDGIIISHTDKDHVGGLKKLLKSGMNVDMLYAGSIHDENSDEDNKVYKSSEKYGVPLTWLSAGDTLDLGKGYSANVLGPLSRDAENENNNSLVIALDTPDGSFLFTGDMELEEESELMNSGLIGKADVLKVSHHGDDDTTSRSFVQAVSPQWSVISTDSGEEPDTPDSKILARLWEVKSGVAVTEDATLGILITLKDGNAEAQSLQYN